mmetsp:Transcript_29195/g.86431  ORF Transcript_29195/g.86431 Transcript_29195/m.86431 type:complete len:206 (+) Transcript_29195:847-1464(+)
MWPRRLSPGFLWSASDLFWRLSRPVSLLFTRPKVHLMAAAAAPDPSNPSARPSNRPSSSCLSPTTRWWGSMPTDGTRSTPEGRLTHRLISLLPRRTVPSVPPSSRPRRPLRRINGTSPRWNGITRASPRGWCPATFRGLSPSGPRRVFRPCRGCRTPRSGLGTWPPTSSLSPKGPWRGSSCSTAGIGPRKPWGWSMGCFLATRAS